MQHVAVNYSINNVNILQMFSSRIIIGDWLIIFGNLSLIIRRSRSCIYRAAVLLLWSGNDNPSAREFETLFEHPRIKLAQKQPFPVGLQSLAAA